MRIERSITTVSWIPSDLLEGMGKIATRMKLAHHDPPPPDSLGTDTAAAIEELRVADRFRFANELRAYIEVDDDGHITDCGYCGGGVIGATTIGLGVGSITIPAVKLSDRCSDPVITATSVTFTQSVGGRTGAPMPRAVKHPPFIQYHAPIVWTTLELTIHTDGTHEGDNDRCLWISATLDVRRLRRTSSPRAVLPSTRSGWLSRSVAERHGAMRIRQRSSTEVESLLERELQESIMRGDKKPDIRRVKEGRTLVEQGSSGDDLYLLLNGVLVVEVDGEKLAELGPGAVFGERASLEGGTRTATLRLSRSARWRSRPPTVWTSTSWRLCPAGTDERRHASSA